MDLVHVLLLEGIHGEERLHHHVPEACAASVYQTTGGVILKQGHRHG
jgi:hypothetical protein